MTPRRRVRPSATIGLAATALVALRVGRGQAASPSGVEITLLVRSQDTPRDKALLSELTRSVVDAGWPANAVSGMADAEREFAHKGLWTYLPWIYKHEKKRQRKRSRVAGRTGQRWLVFLEPGTIVDAQGLEVFLGTYDSTKPYFLGRALKDKEISIVHHYSSEPPYPHVDAGFALSAGLLRRLLASLTEEGHLQGQQIEPVWELAKWLANLKDGPGVGLTDRKDMFCGRQRTGCVTWIDSALRLTSRPSMGLKPADVVIAVKTVGSFHAARIPLINEFWGKSSRVKVVYLSNQPYTAVADADVVDLSPEFGDLVDPAKESTKQGSGHCSKMEAILKFFFRHQPEKRWYVVTDDDTLLNVPRLMEVLDSHNDSKAIYLGERYGWNHNEQYDYGTNYVTTGGGMALSGRTLALLQECKSCSCSSPNAPDDMTLGSWCKSLSIPITHEEGFHQAEPHNYHEELLEHADPPVSFHRFNVRLPASTSETEQRTARQENWKKWKKKYFIRQKTEL